jgi:hypothetical protein
MKATANSLTFQNPRRLWAKAEADFRRMSDSQKVQTLVSAGILTRNLKPTKRYRDLFVSRPKAKSV